MEQYRKKEGNKYYLQELSKESGELEWKEITLVSSTEPKIELENNEKILYPPSNKYYFVNEYPDFVSIEEI
jgi:hypothetical protein